MPVYVAKDYEGYPIDVVFSFDEKLATAYWHGKGIVPHNISVISDANMTDHPTGVLPIVSTREVETTPFGMSTPRKMIVMRKNHN